MCVHVCVRVCVYMCVCVCVCANTKGVWGCEGGRGWEVEEGHYGERVRVWGGERSVWVQVVGKGEYGVGGGSKRN